MDSESSRLCLCGCGGTPNPGRRFLNNHDKRKGPRPTGHGYLRVYHPGHPLAHKDGYVLEHRYVLYEAGVAIPPGHHVHHLNGVKSDNRLENLAVIPESVHHSQHVGAFVVNQSGTHPVLRDPAARKARDDERNRANVRRWRLKYPERARATDQAKALRRKAARS